MTSQQTLSTAANEPIGRRNVRLIIGALIVLCALFALGYAERLNQKEAAVAEVAVMQQKVNEARQRQAALLEERARVDDPAYLADQARDELGLIQVGDQPIAVLNSPATATPAATATPLPRTMRGERPNWQLWVDLLVPAGAERR